MTTTGKVYATGVTADTTLVTTAETIVAQVFNVNVPNGGQAIIDASALVTLGANTTNVVLTVRRGPLVTSPIVGEISNPAAPAATATPFQINNQLVDNVPAEQANQTYTVTITATGASANGNVTQAAASIAVN